MAYIAQCNAHGAPVFVGCIYNEVFLDGQSLTALGQVGVGTVYFAGAFCKRTSHDSRAANVAEGTFLYYTIADVIDKVQGRGSQILEQHRVEVNVMGIAHGDSTHRALYPGLVLEVFVPGQTWDRQFVGINERKTAL